MSVIGKKQRREEQRGKNMEQKDLEGTKDEKWICVCSNKLYVASRWLEKIKIDFCLSISSKIRHTEFEHTP